MRPIKNNTDQYEVKASTFFTFHSVLRNSDDYVEAIKWSRNLAANLTSMLNGGSENQDVSVFPYSFFYVFYEQYLHIEANAFTSVGISVATVVAVVFVMTGEN